MKNRLTFLFKNCQMLTTKVRKNSDIKDFCCGNFVLRAFFNILLMNNSG